MKNTKSVKWNTIANFIGLGYTTIIGIVIFPLYLQFLGAEAFGLVGFFLIMQAWMQLLDMGMSPILSRQAAQARSHNIEFIELKKLLRSFELIFFMLSLIIVLGIAAGSKWIATQWLNVASLPLTDVTSCIVLMGAAMGVRFLSGLYRSGIQGMESQVRLNISIIILATVRFVGALIILQFVTQEIVFFFIYQLVISIVELTVFFATFYHLLSPTDKLGIRIFWDTLKPLLPFAGGLAYTAGIWVLLTQMDKMILSSVLLLPEYGYFTLVAIVATGIIQISGPISQAILPRMTYLLSQNKEQDMLTLYRKSAHVMAIIVLPLTGVIAMFSTELLFAWTGDRKAAEWAGPILFWFALGNGILAISAFQYYLQFAHGKLRIHVIYNTISAIIQIPVIIYVAFQYGALGVALAWFTLKLVAFIIWTPIVHHILAPGIHWPWLLKDIAPTFLLTVFLFAFAQSLNIEFESMSRPEILTTLSGIWFIIFIVNISFSLESRKLANNLIQAIKTK